MIQMHRTKRTRPICLICKQHDHRLLSDQEKTFRSSTYGKFLTEILSFFEQHARLHVLYLDAIPNASITLQFKN